MIRIKSEYEVPRRAGEHYLDEVPGPIRIGRHFRSDELWAYFRGTVQGLPCELRMATIRDELLCGVDIREDGGYTVVTLVRETMAPRLWWTVLDDKWGSAEVRWCKRLHMRWNAPRGRASQDRIM